MGELCSELPLTCYVEVTLDAESIILRIRLQIINKANCGIVGMRSGEAKVECGQNFT